MASPKKLPSGSYRIRVYLGKVDGKEKFASVTARTRREAQLKAIRFTGRAEDTIRFGEAAERYLDAKSNILSPNTIRGYRNILAKLDPIREVKLERLNSEKIQQLINSMSESSPKTIKNAYGFITAVVRMFDPNIKFNVTLPERIPFIAKIPTEKEIIQMVETTNDLDLKLAIQLAAYGSLREGEICALQEDCLTEKGIYIKRTMVQDGKEWKIKNSPKTAAGFREIPLPEPIMELLKDRFEEHDGYAINLLPSGLYMRYKRHLKRIKLHPYSFHSLRHFFATNCHAMGIPDKYIAKLGGWDDIATLQRIYTHTTDEKMEEVVDLLHSHYNDLTRT